MIFNQRACNFDPAALVCSGAKNDTCLSKAAGGHAEDCLRWVRNRRTEIRFIPDFPSTPALPTRAGIPGLLGGPVIPVATGADFLHFDADREAARVDANADRASSATARGPI